MYTDQYTMNELSSVDIELYNEVSINNMLGVNKILER